MTYVRMILEGGLLFVLSFLILWTAFGAMRLNEFNEEIRVDIESCEIDMNEAKYEAENLNPTSAEELENLNTLKVESVTLSYFIELEREVLKEENNLFWSLLDVYSRQRVIYWGYMSLEYPSFSVGKWYGMGGLIKPRLPNVDTGEPGWHESFLFSEDFQDIKQKIESKIEERREDTQCFPDHRPPDGILNERAYKNTESLRILLEDICTDFGEEEDLLLRVYESEAAYFLSKYIQGFSEMKWWEKPIYGSFSRDSFVTFRYIWLDISCIASISFFIAAFSVWWRHRHLG
jgi:hypothetical protein